MLKLTIKPGESVRIGEDVKILLTTSTYNRIQLEIEAPEEVRIQRQKAEVPKSQIFIVKGK